MLLTLSKRATQNIFINLGNQDSDPIKTIIRHSDPNQKEGIMNKTDHEYSNPINKKGSIYKPNS